MLVSRIFARGNCTIFKYSQLLRMPVDISQYFVKDMGRKRKNISDDETKPKKLKSDEQSSSEEEASTSTSNTLDLSHVTGSWNLKISSWNVNGIRAWTQKKDSMNYLKKEDPDIFCIQETKCQDEASIPKEVQNLKGYHKYWAKCELKKGYSGVGLFSKTKPKKVTYGIGVKEHDQEGRVITAEYEKFYLVASYTPNSGQGLKRLDYRQTWDEDFRNYIKNLDNSKPVILCGDLNVAHEEIDLANPKSNTKTAGFTKEERANFSLLLEQGYVDSFRHFYPKKKGEYSFWSYKRNARATNTGWRLDYFVISKRFMSKVVDSCIRTKILGSDHAPILLLLSL